MALNRIQNSTDENQKTLHFKNENWKYFDFKEFEKLSSNLELNKNQTVEVKFFESIEPKIVISEKYVQISSSLSESLKIEISTPKLNLIDQIAPFKGSKLDFEQTDKVITNSDILIRLKKFTGDKIELNYKSENKISSTALAQRFFFYIENSDFDLLETHDEQTKNLFIQSKFILKNSNLRHTTLLSGQNLKELKIINSSVEILENSIYENVNLNLTNSFVRHQISISLDDPISQCGIFSLSISNGAAFSETRTEIMHRHPKGQSQQIFKSIAADSSKSIFNGRIVISQFAQKTDSSQICRGLILSPDAEINIKPELEIYADDVKAAHGAAVGNLSKDQIFYFISRGVKPEEAYKMLAKSFAAEIFMKISNLEIQSRCLDILETSAQSIFEKLIETFKGNNVT